MRILGRKYFLLAVTAVLTMPVAIVAAQESDRRVPASHSDYQAYQDHQRSEFAAFRLLSQSEYDSWRSDDEKRFKAFRREIQRQWGDYVGSTNRTWVEYGDSARSRSIVDFKKGSVTIQVLVRKAGTVLPIVKRQIEKAVERAVDSRGTGQTVLPSLETAEGPDKGVLAEPVLANQVAAADGSIVTPQTAADFARQIADSAAPQKSAAGDTRFEKYTVSFPLVPDHLARRMAPFVTVVKKYCLEYDLNFAQVLALIHTESYFNPLAHSASNAIGLMQLVPSKGGREAFQFVSKDAAASVPPPASLFDPETNIHLGCAYLYLLRTRDFGDVTNKDCGMYCSIASYNGGPACVAFAFTGDSKMQPAIRTINSMNDPDRVYLFLVRNLPAAETRQYLENVVQRTRLYE